MRAADALLAAGDPTRGHAVSDDGRLLLPGLTRPEAEAACVWLATVDPRNRPLVLAEVALPVVLTEGAGPHLLDAPGTLVLVLGPQPHIAGAHVAMGAPSPRYAVGVVREIGGGGWLWLARAEVAEADRVAALDGADGSVGDDALRAWAREWAAAIPTLGM